MAVNEKHPEYSQRVTEWTLMKDTYAGQAAIKAKTFQYLPATQGQIIDGIDHPSKLGYKAYTAYLLRARFPGFVREAVQTAVGMLHHLPPEIKLPSGMEYIKEKATSAGENLTALLRKINEQQLLYGRLGLLLDLPVNPDVGKDYPYISLYKAPTIINWDHGGIGGGSVNTTNLVVLDETTNIRVKGFSWEKLEQYRVLILGDPLANETVGEYRVGTFSSTANSVAGSLEFTMEKMFSPSYRGRFLKEIPFVFINSCDLSSSVDEPPLLDLANLCCTIYRGEADYRQNLFMQGQDTLVIIGGIGGATGDGEESIRTGVGSVIELPMQGDAKYIGVESAGLPEQRSALENDKARAGSMGAQSLDTVSRQRESGSSLQTRIAARTADLNQVAITGAKGLENILKTAARWMGLDESQVEVKPNLDFGDRPVSGQNIVEIQTAKTLGAPISGKSVHKLLEVKGYTSLEYEEEISLLEAEKGGILDKTPVASTQETASNGGGSV